MARSGTQVLGNGRIGALRSYLVRRSALELVVLDGFVLAAVLWITLPGPLSLDPFWVRVLLALSPGLLLVGRSLVLAVHVPGVFALWQLDPSVEPPPHPLLDEARHLAGIGFALVGVTIPAVAALAAAWQLAAAF